MKFDTIIMNPPYKGSIHLDFFENGLDLLNEGGQLVIVEPATWLINVRKNGKAKRYDVLKKRIEGHVKSVVVENLNDDFGTALFQPFSVTSIDMGNTYETIDFCCFGEHKQVGSIYDCNLVGDYNIIHSIIGKVQKYGDFMGNHTTKEVVGENMWYAKYQKILGQATGLCDAIVNRGCRKYEREGLWAETKNGSYTKNYFGVGYHPCENKITNTPLCSLNSGKKTTEKIADNIYGTKEELENWKWFIHNNKLPLFLSVCLIIDQNNTVEDYLPWLVDKQHTDEEINQMFGFSKEEIELMDKTIKKFEKNSPWFRRYICGYSEVSDEEVQNFINSL